ncbi:SpoIIE family protein phosphatase [Candidatus Enterovibrio altilux]|uniref:DNA-binding response regulator n=1 Tax=Candidatus Enterovibrio altilux TaxID=1927128 RepID=A0A291B6V6_9GAMM|nr:SpoIIE family protein phosphatase [Candidatus Enterovibrio luxaltus]ATF08728.1 DNA-binding response regulator [Candidatus Enterovibrio luxaltus]
MVSIVSHECRPATLKSISLARKNLNNVFKKHAVPDHITNKILLCFAEAATNLVNHSNLQPTFIHIDLECNNDSWKLHLSDDGQSWNPKPPDRVQLHDIFKDKEGGRGLALIHSLSDDMEYKIHDTIGKNTLTLKWHRQKFLTKPSILIVDDDICQRRLYSAYLCEDYHVIDAESGEAALSLLLQQDVDLVISDIRMPRMDGLSLKKALHKESNTLLTPFIFLTYADNPEILESAMGLGIDDYLIKPVSKPALIQSVTRVLNRSAQIYRQLTDRVNKRITDSLTPSLPKKAYGWEMTVISRNTGIGGGDLVLHRGNSRCMMLNVVDIMGHDVTAKFFSYAFGGYLRGLMYHIDHETNPCTTLLSRLSDSALEDGLLSQVILTCCSAVLSDNGKIEVATAGHPAPFKISPTCTQLIDVGGILPGVIYGANYESITIYLANNERLAIYTDGLFEAAENDQARKILSNSIMTTLQNTLILPIDEAAQRVMQTFDRKGERYRDDATLVLLQRAN